MSENIFFRTIFWYFQANSYFCIAFQRKVVYIKHKRGDKQRYSCLSASLPFYTCTPAIKQSISSKTPRLSPWAND